MPGGGWLGFSFGGLRSGGVLLCYSFPFPVALLCVVVLFFLCCSSGCLASGALACSAILVCLCCYFTRSWALLGWSRTGASLLRTPVHQTLSYTSSLGSCLIFLASRLGLVNSPLGSNITPLITSRLCVKPVVSPPCVTPARIS